MDSRRRSGQLLLWPLGAALAAVLVGALVGFLLLAVLSAGDASTDAWAGLGRMLLSVFVGFCVGLVTWVLGLVWVACRYFPRGRRAVVVALSIAAVVALVAITGLVSGVLDGATGVPEGFSGLGLLAVAAPSFVFSWWGRRVGSLPGGLAEHDPLFGPGTTSGSQAVEAPARFHGPTEWRPEG